MKTVKIDDLVKKNKKIVKRRKEIEKLLKDLQKEDNRLLRELHRNNDIFKKLGKEEIR